MRFVSRHRGPLLAGVLAILAAATAVNFLLIGGALDKLSRQAKDGRLAHQRQCAVYPVSRKLYAAAHEYGLITARELDTYLSMQPTGCR